MRAFIATAFVLISFGFFALPAPSTAFADDACRCTGCGCKGGRLARSRRVLSRKETRHFAGRRCLQENAPRICFGKQAAVDRLGRWAFRA